MVCYYIDQYTHNLIAMAILGNESVQEMLSVLWPEDDLLIVSGGSPSSLIDGHCVTILDHDKTYALQLTSSVKGQFQLHLAKA